MTAADAAGPLVSIKRLTTQFRITRSIFDRRPLLLRAVDDVSFDIAEESIVGLVGESGSGKTTLARTLVRLEPATSGSATLAGEEIIQISNAAFRPFRRKIQMIFQDPYGSLNPRKRIGDIVAEGLRIHGIGKPAERRETVAILLKKVGLPSDAASRFPHEFSGGQRQRVGIARALAVEPKFLIADEPVSALDVSIQAQVLNLLINIKREFRLGILLISHDLGVVRVVSDFVAVMYLGRVVESAPTSVLFREPKHPYTKALLSAVPVTDPRKRRVTQPVAGDVPSPFSPPSGCSFRTRCQFARPKCAEVIPEPRSVGTKHTVACIRDDLL